MQEMEPRVVGCIVGVTYLVGLFDSVRDGASQLLNRHHIAPAHLLEHARVHIRGPMFGSKPFEVPRRHHHLFEGLDQALVGLRQHRAEAEKRNAVHLARAGQLGRQRFQAGDELWCRACEGHLQLRAGLGQQLHEGRRFGAQAKSR